MRFALALLLFLIPACASPTQEDPTPGPEWPAPGEWGPYGVGVTTFTVAAPAPGWTDRTVDIWVWYPTRPSVPGESAIYLGNWSAQALQDVPPDKRGAPYPTVMFSHGSSAFAVQSVFFTEHLASRGFVVVAPEHSGNTYLDDDRTDMVVDGMIRPRDVSLALDAMLEAPPDALAGLVDEERVGVSGHSFGAFTSVLLSGCLVDMDAVRAECRAPCEALSDLPLTGTHDASDARIKGSMPMTVGGSRYFHSTGPASVFAPTLQLAAGLDSTTPAVEEALPLHEAMAGPAAVYLFETAGHFTFSHMCEIFPFIGDGCGDGFTDPLEAQRITTVLGDAFFGHLLQDAEAFPLFSGCAESPWDGVGCQQKP